MTLLTSTQLLRVLRGEVYCFCRCCGLELPTHSKKEQALRVIAFVRDSVAWNSIVINRLMGNSIKTAPQESIRISFQKYMLEDIQISYFLGGHTSFANTGELTGFAKLRVLEEVGSAKVNHKDSG